VKSFFEGFELRNNRIINNNIGIQTGNYDGDYPAIKQNEICHNETYNVENTDDINKDLTGNCWCTEDSATIESKLYDGYDNIYLGLFNYDIYDENCDTIIKTITKVNLGTGIYLGNAEKFVSIYPNPFETQLFVRLKTGQVEHLAISIYSMYGQKVYEGYCSNEVLIIPGIDIDPGLYICTIKTNAFTINKKLIKR